MQWRISLTSSTDEPSSAEQRFREAFTRLKSNSPQLLPRGALVSQNNVAKEAGCDPSALRKARFPSLVREIQAYVELHRSNAPSKRQDKASKRAANADLSERFKEVVLQRDHAQSQLLSAHVRVVELALQVEQLTQELAKLRNG